MSLTVARSIAYSALSASSVRIAVTSANIANADTEGYTRKTAEQSAVVYGTTGAGVSIASVTAAADRLLQKSLVAAHSKTAAAETADDYAQRLASLMGSVATSSDDDGGSIADLVASLETALASLASTPESDTVKAAAVSALDDVAAALRETSSAIQDLRADADQSIEDDVAAANAALHRIDELNDAIVAAEARGEATGDLEDQRATTLTALSGYLDVSYSVGSDKRMRVTTSAGKTLVGDAVNELSFTAAATVTASSTYSATPPSALSGVTVGGDDVTASIKGGSIAAAIAARDTSLPAAQDELDALAGGLIETLDAIHNDGTADPAPASLTGSAQVAGSDALAATGAVRIAVVDADGVVSAVEDFDLSAYATIDDMVAAIDATSGVSASLDADGHLVIASDDAALGVAVTDLDAAIGADGEGFSERFGLNDLLTGTGASDIAVRSDILSSPSRLATASLSTEAGLAAGDAGIASGAGTVPAALQAAFTTAVDFDAAGGLSARSRAFADYAGDILSAATSAASRTAATAQNRQTVEAGLSDRFSSETGVNIDEETAALSDLQQQYETAAQIVSVLNSLFDTLLDMAQSA